MQNLFKTSLKVVSLNFNKESIKTGESITVSVSCPSGTLTWTAPGGYAGASPLTPTNRTTYSAKCVSSDGKS